MSSFPFPPSSKEPRREEKQKKPEFIFVEEGSQEYSREEQQEQASQIFSDLHRLSQVRVSFSIRILCFLMALLCALWFLGSLLCAFPFALATLATGGCVEGPRNWLFHFSDKCKKAATFGTGFFIAVFSPVLGLCFIFLAYLFRGELKEVSAFVNRWSKK